MPASNSLNYYLSLHFYSSSNSITVVYFFFNDENIEIMDPITPKSTKIEKKTTKIIVSVR